MDDNYHWLIDISVLLIRIERDVSMDPVDLDICLSSCWHADFDVLDQDVSAGEDI